MVRAYSWILRHGRPNHLPGGSHLGVSLTCLRAPPSQQWRRRQWRAVFASRRRPYRRRQVPHSGPDPATLKVCTRATILQTPGRCMMQKWGDVRWPSTEPTPRGAFSAAHGAAGAPDLIRARRAVRSPPHPNSPAAPQIGTSRVQTAVAPQQGSKADVGGNGGRNCNSSSSSQIHGSQIRSARMV